jgi:hypothetical protein
MNAQARLDARKAQVVEMRFFGRTQRGRDSRSAQSVSSVTVKRDCSTAKLWLYRELAGGAANGLRSMEASR